MTTNTIPRPTTTTRRPAARPVPSRRTGDLAALLAGFGGGITLAITLPTVLGTTLGAPGGIANSIGILTAMVGTYLALLAIVLMARLPWVEREIGQDRLTAWHRKLGPWTLLLITAHVIATPLGYAQAEQQGWWSELTTMTFSHSWMLPAAVAFVMMAGLGIISWRAIRHRMSYETWYVAHLYLYLAVALAFGHQIGSGSVFVNHPLATAWWTALYIALAGAVIAFRIAPPLLNARRHQLRVSAVVPIDVETAHVYVTGRDLDRLNASGGQWFSWRFATRDWWWQGHPYSLSAAPTPNTLRITVKNLGDQSGAITGLRPGTRVIAEGPYGAFRADRRHGDCVALVGAGIGMAPLLSLLDDLPRHVDAVVIYRASSIDQMPLRSDLERLVSRREGHVHLHLLPGSRREHPMDARSLASLVPDIEHRDVYTCGPVEFIEAVGRSSRELGVTPDRIHDEDFQF